MTELLCHRDSYLKEFEGKVTQVTDKGVVLDRTAFYPGGGGQPSDTGTLEFGGRMYRVTGVSGRGGVVVHEIDGEKPAAGSVVKGRIDWERRHQLMRTHTALHILCGVIWRDYGAQVTGGDMKPLEARMDFELESMTADFAQQVEAKVNAEVSQGRPVYATVLHRDEAFKIPDLIRTKINLLPPQIQQVRVVDIQGLDMQADGGTHVANTREVGRIRVVGHESKGRINKRLRIAVE
ncbi:MAG: alanyl-tRNA editing protein [SAR202 cluster bacterium]|nr:alanyl-tRNA editing protein [SAR202 cluster bacterium]